MTAPLYVSDPQPGYFRLRLVKGGPWAPARIWRRRNGTLGCHVHIAPRDPVDAWSWLAGENIPRKEYLHLWRVYRWARANPRSRAPECTPFKPIDPLVTALPF